MNYIIEDKNIPMSLLLLENLLFEGEEEEEEKV